VKPITKWITLSLSIILLVTVSSTYAQNVTILTLGLPEYMMVGLPRDLFDEFEAAHNVDVIVRPIPQQNNPLILGFGTAEQDDAFFEALPEYATSNDVLYFDWWMQGVEATRSGYLLDMTPLINADVDFDPSDFYPAAYNAYQWDGGFWAMPITMHTSFLSYNPEAFDQAGLPYPDENWDFNQYAAAIRALTPRNEQGQAIGYAFNGSGTALLRAFYGANFADANGVPTLTDPALVALYGEWAALSEEIKVDEGNFDTNFDYMASPIINDQVWSLREFEGMTRTETQRVPFLYPGGFGQVDVQALFISAATQQTQLAYELVKFMSSSVDVFPVIFGDTPARRSVQANLPAQDFMGALSPENEAFLARALENAITPSDLRFANYLFGAQNQITQGMSVEDAVAEMQARAEANLARAEAMRGQAVTQVIAQPEPTPVLTTGEVAIKFDLQANVSPLPNREQWDAAMEEFAAADAQVGFVDFYVNNMGADREAAFDCAYMSFVDFSNPNMRLLPLDPLVSVDPNFDRADFLGNSLEQLSQEGVLYGYPTNIQPFVLWYDPAALERANVPQPAADWTISEFIDALNALNSANPDVPQLNLSWNAGTVILMLTAAYGGSPIDYSTAPDTFNLTDPQNVQAMQQALDLARDGVLKYTQISQLNAGNVSFISGGSNGPAFDADIISSFNYRLSSLNTTSEDAPIMTSGPTQPAAFPRGSGGTPVSFSAVGMYINAETLYPEACYRLISYLGSRPELFVGMPARGSYIDNPVLEQAFGTNVVDTYRNIAAQITAPDAILLPSPFISTNTAFESSLIEYIALTWVYDVWDRYVTSKTPIDLAAELAQTQAWIDEYMVCANNVPRQEFSMVSLQDSESDRAAFDAYIRAFGDCAVSVDPRMEKLFPEETPTP
jgi:ABC-type glycerol-3-phosphate transport system substrate-binding protein